MFFYVGNDLLYNLLDNELKLRGVKVILFISGIWAEANSRATIKDKDGDQERDHKQSLSG
ncbi:MAG: hypothetical protein WAO52_07610 [Prolixibacteraceae bacterium]